MLSFDPQKTTRISCLAHFSRISSTNSGKRPGDRNISLLSDSVIFLMPNKLYNDFCRQSYEKDLDFPNLLPTFFSLLIKLLYLGNHILHLLVYFQEVGIEDALTRLDGREVVELW